MKTLDKSLMASNETPQALDATAVVFDATAVVFELAGKVIDVDSGLISDFGSVHLYATFDPQRR
jgi:hypothetical protein